MPRKAPMSDREIVSFVRRKLQQSLNEGDGDISDLRVRNFDLYMGKPYGNERDGYSSIVTREALETVEWALPSLLRVFTAGDRVVSYDPVGPEDEEEAEQQTDIANYFILKRNNGFKALYDWFKDCLMYPNGYIGLWIEEKQKSRLEEYEGLSAMGLQQVLTSLAEKGDVEVVEQSSEVKQSDQGEYECYNVKIRVSWVDKRPILEPIPPDELLVDNDMVGLDLDEADSVIRRLQKTYTQLVREGYDPERLDALGTQEDYEWLDERTNRLFYDDEDPDGEEEDDDSMRQFWVHDCYLYIDTDGDGIAEQRHITMIGAEIFVNEEVSYQPYVAMSAIPIPHKHPGLSYIDLVDDLQEIRSALWRQLLDNIYKLNVRRKYIGDNFISDEGGTLDVLLDNTSEFIPARDPHAINEETVTPIVADILPVLQGTQDMTKMRSGISPEVSLDPDVLQQSTAGAFTKALDKSSERIELTVRVFAETGMKKLFQKTHQLLRTNIDREQTIKLRGKWVEFDPTTWEERENVTVSTGLGFNNKEQKVMLLHQLLQLQKEAMGAGLSDVSRLYNSLDELIESAGLGHTERYFVDPKSEEYQPPEPKEDPFVQVEMAKIQANAQTEQAKLQMEQQRNAREDQKGLAELRFKMNEEQRKNQELMMRMREMEAKINGMAADREAKVAQMFKTYEEAQGQDIENDQMRNDPGLGPESSLAGGRESQKESRQS